MTACIAIADQGLRTETILDLRARPGSDADEHRFQCEFDADPAAEGEQVVLQFGGIATLSEVVLNGQTILRGTSMFEPYEADVSRLLRGTNDLLIVCKPLTEALRACRRREPVLRWRTRVVSEQQLRWIRTTILGRAPGFAPDPPIVGPWRPVTLVRRRFAIESWKRSVELDGATGIVRVEFEMSTPVPARLHVGDDSAPLEWVGNRGTAAVRIPHAQLWWPHTHGEPALYSVSLELTMPDGATVWQPDAPAGFRTIQGLPLIVNRVPIFCRGVVWFPAPDGSEEQRLRLLRDAGFNMVRLAGTGVYESERFHRLCDELGILVWQDLMFANMDYPFADPDFHDSVTKEADRELARVGRHASTAVICGNSEIEQQVGMLGLDPAIARGDFFGKELPAIAARNCPGVPYIPSAPYGGDQPFRTRAGVANYFGVGAYLRPFEDVRRANVPFASECLAFANVPEPESIERMSLANPGGISPTHPAWKRGVPRDSGAGWDFEDVRDHYLRALYTADPAALRYADQRRYWELSRMVSGEVMAEVFGEWRRADSPCAGGIILQAADLVPGAGWGILDSDGVPKAAYWFLKRALAPVAIWMTCEGLNGIDVHVSNDRPELLDAFLRVALYARGEEKIHEAESPITVAPNDTVAHGVEQLLGRFVDASYSYRFGPPGHDLVVASLHLDRGGPVLAQAFRFPVAHPATRVAMAELGITARFHETELLLSAHRFAWGVRVASPGATPSDNYFGLEPGGTRRVVFSAEPRELSITALNAEGPLTIA
jgi:beta-mannosidase